MMPIWEWFLRAFDPTLLWGGDGVAADTEAFLSGRLLERAREIGEPWEIPGWYWLNAVAHGSPERLRTLASETARTPGTPEVRMTYPAARALLAHDLLFAGGGSLARLEQIQRELLVPLELDLARDGRVTPRSLLWRARAELGPLLR